MGRLPGLDLPLASESVSKEHAELSVRDGAFRVRDLGSKNGTLVNNERVSEAMLREGDILHFAQVEFRVGRLEIEARTTSRARAVHGVALRDEAAAAVRRGRAGAARAAPRAAGLGRFQPIVSLPTGTLVGYEALGRGRHPRLPEAPLRPLRDRDRDRRPRRS